MSVLHLLVLRGDRLYKIFAFYFTNSSKHQTAQPDLKPEVNLLCQQVIKCLSVGSRQFSGQHNSNEGPWCFSQGVGEHVDAGVGQQHGRARGQRVEPVTHLGGGKVRRELRRRPCDVTHSPGIAAAPPPGWNSPCAHGPHRNEAPRWGLTPSPSLGRHHALHQRAPTTKEVRAHLISGPLSGPHNGEGGVSGSPPPQHNGPLERRHSTLLFIPHFQ